MPVVSLLLARFFRSVLENILTRVRSNSARMSSWRSQAARPATLPLRPPKSPARRCRFVSEGFG